MDFLFQEYGLIGVLGVALIALITSIIHGATGVAGGFLLAAGLAPVIGVAPIVPVISISLLISHSARAILNIKDFDKGAFLAIAIPALPCNILMALIYGSLSSSLIAIILGLVILTSIPMRRWAKSRNIKATKVTLSGVGAIYGALSGVSIGPGILLSPFMLGYGLKKEAFVATLAVIALVANITRTGAYGWSDLLTSEYILLGVLAGLVTIPGNWIGRKLLRNMTNKHHSNLIEVLMVLGALNFFWLATF